MERAYYKRNVADFLLETTDQILGTITHNNQFEVTLEQRNTWVYEINLLKSALQSLGDGTILFEYTIPRVGHRIDNVLLYRGIVYLLEFKVGSNVYSLQSIHQVVDYALDLKNFHKESHDRDIVPILIATKAAPARNKLTRAKDGVYHPILCSATDLCNVLESLSCTLSQKGLDPDAWYDSPYMPTPTIIEAAQALYHGHHVADISRSDASAYNLSATTLAVNRIVEDCKQTNKKAICFITGVPGAGKTLAGLNIANERHNFDEDEHAVFLSGNQPLVSVLQEALARDDVARSDGSLRKAEAERKAKAFIQIIHHFRDDATSTQAAPYNKIAIFDEAQRAWSESALVSFMARKKGIPDFCMSEPEFLISIMDRHQDWAVIVALIGGGQEINTGEAGVSEWFHALQKDFSNWNVFLSPEITDEEYIHGKSLEDALYGLKYTFIHELHLGVSLRSFRSEKLAEFVKELLAENVEKASALYQSIGDNYPIKLTRNLDTAKRWVKAQARGTERYGLIASSGAMRLRTQGIWVQCKVDATNWFLNDAEDVRSSYFLEETATEFDIQGLEIDWSIVAWDADFRHEPSGFAAYRFRGNRWNTVHNEEDKLYRKNAYRVLLTRARQGLVIFLPTGDASDTTRLNQFYDGTYAYLKSIGIEEI